MKIHPSDFLRLAENASTLCFWDTETTGFKGDYDSILVLSVKPYGKDPISFAIKQPGNDERVVREARDYLNEFDCWVTYYGKGFDKPMLNTRLLKWGLKPLDKVHHIDLYYTLKSKLNTARRSQGHLLEWLGTPEQKMTVSADMWVEVIRNPQKAMKTLIERCESDAKGLEDLYQNTKHLIEDIRAE